MCAPGSGPFIESSPAAGDPVRARVPAKPMKSVFKREPRDREEQKSGPKEALQRAGQ